jgi:phosphonate transport system substrate-binding protein
MILDSQKKWALTGVVRRFYFLLAFLCITACVPGILQKPTPTPTPTATPSPTNTPEPKPLGSPENPVTIGFVSNESDAGNQLAAMIQQASGYAVASKPLPDDEAVLREMRAGTVHLGWLPPFTYLFANQEGFAKVMLVSNHFGVYGYGTQFLANIESGITPFFNPATNANTGEAENVLAQFAGKKPCWVSPTSASGYVVPNGLLAQNDVHVVPGAFLQDHTAVIRALYIKGICDFGVTFALSGDPRTALSLQDLPDVQQRIQVIWRSESVIPNQGLFGLPELPEDMRKNLSDAFLSIAKTDPGRATLSAAFQYDIQDLAAVDDTVFDPLRLLLKQSGVDLTSLIGY